MNAAIECCCARRRLPITGKEKALTILDDVRSAQRAFTAFESLEEAFYPAVATPLKSAAALAQSATVGAKHVSNVQDG